MDVRIDRGDYNSSAGLSTKHWGPKGWYFLFSCIMGGYPVRLNKRNDEHLRIKRHFKSMFVSLGYTMPCSFCRNSYRDFMKELPIEPFLKGRIPLMTWLYTIKDKVNNKLIQQERECYQREFKELIQDYADKKITRGELTDTLRIRKAEIFITKPSPSFKSVLDTYESIRADCSSKAKTCAIKSKK